MLTKRYVLPIATFAIGVLVGRATMIDWSKLDAPDKPPIRVDLDPEFGLRGTPTLIIQAIDGDHVRVTQVTI